MLTVVSDTHSTDTHRLSGRTLDAVREAEVVAHAGDFMRESVLDGFQRETTRLLGVAGNNDDAAIRDRLPEARTFTFAGVTFAMTHTRRGGSTALSLFGRERGADVVVARLADDSTVAEAVPYSEQDSVPGLYAPDDPSLVEPETTYRLRVETGDGAPLTATTNVPDAITVVGSSNDTTTYQSPRQPAFTIEPPRALTDRQNVYTFTATSLLDFERTPDSVLTAALTPFYADGFDAEDDSLASLRITSSGLLNEGNFTRNADGTITVRLPWIAVAFYGPNEVAVNVVDDNFYDLLRSQQVQQGGFSPGEIPNVIEHVEGGTGIFGSYARAARAFVIRPPDSLGAVRPSAGP